MRLQTMSDKVLDWVSSSELLNVTHRRQGWPVALLTFVLLTTLGMQATPQKGVVSTAEATALGARARAF
jgi:hypothetical protein